MRIFYYETRKSWLRISVLIALIIFTALNFIRIYPGSEDKRYRLEKYTEVCEIYGGEWDNEKLDDFNEKYTEVEDNFFGGQRSEPGIFTDTISNDYFVLNQIKKEIEYEYLYPNYVHSISGKAHENAELYAESGAEFEHRSSEMIEEIYADRTVPEFHGTNWASFLFRYDFSSLLCIILLILGMSASFSAENESGMMTQIAANGKVAKTLLAKVTSAMVYCALLSVWFSFSDILFTHIFYTIDGIEMPIYSSELFQKTPYNITFADAFLLRMGIRFYSLFCLSVLIMLVSKFCSNTMTAMFSSFIVCIGLILLAGFFKGVWNPVCALYPSSYLTDFKCANIAEKPVLMLFMAIAIMTLEFAAFAAAILIHDKLSRRRR